MNRQLLFLLIAFNLAATGAWGQTTRYVKAGGTNAVGTSWDTAGELQLVINASSPGDSVFVAAGVYTGSYFMKEGVQVYGGFAADGSQLHAYQRGEVEGANASTLDGKGLLRPVTQAKDFSVPTVWDGFVIRNGKANLEVGSVIFSVDGSNPVGVVYKYDAATGGGYMLNINEVKKLG